MEWTVAVALAAVVLAAGGYGGWALWPRKCGELKEADGECVGVTDEAFNVDDPAMQELLNDVEKQNAEVKQDHESGPKDPYVRIALMMPFAVDSKSSMTSGMVRRAVAGAVAAQREANEGSGPNYQLLLAPNGEHLDKWDEVTKQLPEMAEDTEAPLVGVTGISSSTENSKDAVEKLSELGIPTIAPVATSAKMKTPHLFKTAPSNEQFAAALDAYLDDRSGSNPGSAPAKDERGYLVYDEKDEDIYASNLMEVFKEWFDDDYGIAHNNDVSFNGGSVAGEKSQGSEQRFDKAVRQVCGGDHDTVFFAGRDQDLRFFIEELARKGGCGDDRRLRIVKVGIGLESTLTNKETTGDLSSANATVINAASVDPAWWQDDNGTSKGASKGVRDLRRQIHDLNGSHALGRNPLDDGNAAMYYDAFMFLAGAVDDTFDEDEENKKPSSSPKSPRMADVYDTLRNSTVGGKNCPECLRGASGTYGFEGGSYDQWAVCKPVPVIEYGPGSPADDDASRTKHLYRTYEDRVTCPD